MKTNLEFRKCNLEDLDLLIRISKQTFVDAFQKDNNPEDFKAYIERAFSKATMTSELQNTNSHFYFVYFETDLVGYFKLNEAHAQNESFSESSIELERIYVIKDYQKRGFGKGIVDYIIAFSKAKHVALLWLGVWEENKGAIKFYERYGFIKSGEHPYYIGSDKQTDWIMKLILN